MLILTDTHHASLLMAAERLRANEAAFRALPGMEKDLPEGVTVFDLFPFPLEVVDIHRALHRDPDELTDFVREFLDDPSVPELVVALTQVAPAERDLFRTLLETIAAEARERHVRVSLFACLPHAGIEELARAAGLVPAHNPFHDRLDERIWRNTQAGALELITQGILEHALRGGDDREPLRETVLALAAGRTATPDSATLVQSEDVAAFLCGDSPELDVARAAIRTAVAAGPRLNVLVTGESGTGRLAVARAIHTLSPEATAPYVVVECRAETRESLGALLTEWAGSIEPATLVLHELLDAPPDVRTLLLHALDRGELPVAGGVTPKGRVIVTARSIALANDAEGAAILIRVAEVQAALPSLNALIGHGLPELTSLVRGLLENLATQGLRDHDGEIFDQERAGALLAPDPFEKLLKQLAAHEWSGGNARELARHLRRRVLLGDCELRAGDRAEAVGDIPGLPAYARLPKTFAEVRELDEVVRGYVGYVMESFGNEGPTKVAERLGISYNTLIKKLNKT
jgi:hypothetical protein